MATGTRSIACTVVLHDDNTSKEHVLCGSKVLPPGRAGYLFAPGTKRLCIVCKDAAKFADEVSVHVAIRKHFGFENRMKAYVEPVENVEDATATHVELFFRDQYLSRADMWRMEAEIDTTVLYQGQNLNYLGSTVATVDSVYIAGKQQDSACVLHPNTKLIFRSGSASCILLIQVSQEMLECWNNGDLMYERLTDGFLPDMFRRWEKIKARHQITIALFGRESRNTSDFYRVVATDIPSSDTAHTVQLLRRAFDDVNLPRQVCLAAKGNMLEAISIAAMDFVRSNIDPRLASTGSEIIAITAGTGVFEAEHDLLRRTTRLLMGNSVGVDIVSLSPKPAHPVPLFKYVQNGSTQFSLPHWADISYWRSEHDRDFSDWVLHDGVEDVLEIALPLANLDEIDAYDARLFSPAMPPDSPRILHTSLSTRQRSFTTDTVKPNVDRSNAALIGVKQDREADTTNEGRPKAPRPSSSSGLQRPKRSAPPPHPLMQMGRTISVGPKGLALSSAVASTSVSAQHAEHGREPAKEQGGAASNNPSGIAQQIRASLRRQPSKSSIASSEATTAVEQSRPVEISANVDEKSESPSDPASMLEKAIMEGSDSRKLHGEASLSATPKASGLLILPSVDPEEQYHAAVSPWLTLLNPCNPREDNMRVASEYRQWQNVFPRRVGPDTFRWESMCCPAVLPLLRETRMSLTDLEEHFSKKVRKLVTTAGFASTAMREMIALRLAVGFQVVPTRILKDTQMSSGKIERMLLSLGDVYHELRCSSQMEVQVSEYHREILLPESPAAPDYTAMIRSGISRKDCRATSELVSTGSDTDWQSLDDHCANPIPTTENLGFFRMRLVLLPVDFAHGDSRTDPNAKGLSDQELRIEGIQRLTQLWQRNRYISADEQQHFSSMNKSKMSPTGERDPDPLAIEYQSGDPSAVVTTFGLNLEAQAASEARVASLFPKSDLFHSSNFDIQKLVKQMQEPAPIGVEMRDRRWFTHSHPNCFRGDEMVNWLSKVFKDLVTREDAVKLGNKLMDEDLFTHVRGKHEFRDGNYFYQIKSAHRTKAYPDTTSLFTKTLGRSTPSTPLLELKQSPTTRAIHGDSDSSGKGSPTPALGPVGSHEKSKVVLTQRLQYNVDQAKKSSQLEVVDLHYGKPKAAERDSTRSVLTTCRSHTQPGELLSHTA